MWLALFCIVLIISDDCCARISAAGAAAADGSTPPSAELADISAQLLGAADGTDLDSFTDDFWGSALGTAFDWAAFLPPADDLGAEPAPF